MQSRQMRQLHIKAVYLQLFLVHWGWGFLQRDLLSPALFQFLKDHNLVASEYLHLPVRSHAIVANELHTLAAKCFRFCARTQVASTFPCAFSIFTWSSFIRLTKNAVGSWLGSFCDKTVPLRHLGHAKGRLGPARLQYRSVFQNFNLIGWVRVY